VKRSQFEYDLPEELIAQEPPESRDGARMLVLDRKGDRLHHRRFVDLPSLLSGDELIVFNDTRVFPARLWARKNTGGRVELLALKVCPDAVFAAMTRSSKGVAPGAELTLARTGIKLRVEELLGGGRATLRAPEGTDLMELFHREGSTPLPPYIRREALADDAADRERYQTIFAREPGSVAAPTAGLHFSPAVRESVRKLGCGLAPVTLHVGPGTFQPVRVETVESHQMEGEHYTVPEETAAAVNAARRDRRPVLAVGTTTVRCLESAAREGGGKIAAGPGYSELFIYPGFRFQAVDRLLTNFHLPGSTLLMLVSALAGRDRVMGAYEEAVRERYRFYSYGDCMLLL